MWDIDHITLDDYGWRLDNLDEVDQGFQPVTHVFLEIKIVVLTSLKENQFSGNESEDNNSHLTHFLEAWSTIKPTRVLEYDKRLCLFVYSLSGRAKDWLNALPSVTIAIWDQLKKAFLSRFSQQQNPWRRGKRFLILDRKMKKLCTIHGRDISC